LARARYQLAQPIRFARRHRQPPAGRFLVMVLVVSAPQPTVEALMYSLRERGTKALEEATTKRRLSELSDQQLVEVGHRLQRLRVQIARAWTATEVEILFRRDSKDER
jgi:hypothetical protein